MRARSASGLTTRTRVVNANVLYALGRYGRLHSQPNTAFAVLTLLNAGRHSPLVDPAVAYLRA